LGRRSGFSLEEIDRALVTAGASEKIRLKVKASLAGTRKPGRKPVDDEPLVIRLAQFVQDGQKPYGAATAATEGMPPHERKTVRGRIYKKYNASPELWQERARLARMTEEEKAAERRAEIEQMRERLRQARRE
jgi:hypothetical protein